MYIKHFQQSCVLDDLVCLFIRWLYVRYYIFIYIYYTYICIYGYFTHVHIYTNTYYILYRKKKEIKALPTKYLYKSVSVYWELFYGKVQFFFRSKFQSIVHSFIYLYYRIYNLYTIHNIKEKKRKKLCLIEIKFLYLLYNYIKLIIIYNLIRILFDLLYVRSGACFNRFIYIYNIKLFFVLICVYLYVYIKF